MKTRKFLSLLICVVLLCSCIVALPQITAKAVIVPNVITEAFDDAGFSQNLWSNYNSFTVAGGKVTGVTDATKVMAVNGSNKVDRPMTQVSFDVSLQGTDTSLATGSEKWAYLYPIYCKVGVTTVNEAVVFMANTTNFMLADNRTDTSLAGRGIGTNITSTFNHTAGAYPSTPILGVSSVTAPVHMTITYNWTSYNQAGGWKVAWTLTAEFTPASGTDPVVVTTSATDTITAVIKPSPNDFTFALCNPTTLDNVVLTYPGVPSYIEVTEAFNDTGFSQNLWSNYNSFTVAGGKVTGVTDATKVMAANGSNKVDRPLAQVSFDVSLQGTDTSLATGSEKWAYLYPIYHTAGATTVNEAVVFMANTTNFMLADNRTDTSLAGRGTGTNITSTFNHAAGAYPSTPISGVSSVTAPVHMTITYNWANYNQAGGWKVSWALKAEFTPASGTVIVVLKTSATDTITAATKPAPEDFTFALCNPTTLDNVVLKYLPTAAPEALGTTVRTDDITKLRFGFDFSQAIAVAAAESKTISEFGAYVVAGNYTGNRNALLAAPTVKKLVHQGSEITNTYGVTISNSSDSNNIAKPASAVAYVTLSDGYTYYSDVYVSSSMKIIKGVFRDTVIPAYDQGSGITGTALATAIAGHNGGSYTYAALTADVVDGVATSPTAREALKAILLAVMENPS